MEEEAKEKLMEFLEKSVTKSKIADSDIAEYLKVTTFAWMQMRQGRIKIPSSKIPLLAEFVNIEVGHLLELILSAYDPMLKSLIDAHYNLAPNGGKAINSTMGDDKR